MENKVKVAKVETVATHVAETASVPALKAKTEKVVTIKKNKKLKKGAGIKLEKTTAPTAKIEKPVVAVKAKKTTAKEQLAPASICKPEIEKCILASPAYKDAPADKKPALLDKARRNAHLVHLPIPANAVRKNKQIYSSIIGLACQAIGVSPTHSKNYCIMAHFGMYYTASGTLCTEFFGKHTMYLPYVALNIPKYVGWTYKSLMRAKPEDFKAVFEQVAKHHEQPVGIILKKVLEHLHKSCQNKDVPVLVGVIKSGVKNVA